MPIQSRIEAIALNIRMRNKHDPMLYVKLLEDTNKIQRENQRPINIRGDQHAVLGRVRVNHREKGPIYGVHGDIHRFTQIDKDGHWYNFVTSKEAEESDTESISVPEHLKPNYKSFYFEFFPKSHRMVVQVKGPNGKSMGPTSVKKFFESAFDDEKIKEKYGEIDITIEPTTDALEKIFSIPQLRKVTMEIMRPNPDEFGDLEEDLLKELKDQDAEQVTYIYDSEKGKSLKLSKKTKAIAKVASQNGVVEAFGKDATQHPINESTKAHPLQEFEYYDKDKELESSAFNRLANKVLNLIV